MITFHQYCHRIAKNVNVSRIVGRVLSSSQCCGWDKFLRMWPNWKVHEKKLKLKEKRWIDMETADSHTERKAFIKIYVTGSLMLWWIEMLLYYIKCFYFRDNTHRSLSHISSWAGSCSPFWETRPGRRKHMLSFNIIVNEVQLLFVDGKAFHLNCVFLSGFNTYWERKETGLNLPRRVNSAPMGTIHRKNRKKINPKSPKQTKPLQEREKAGKNNDSR